MPDGMLDVVDTSRPAPRASKSPSRGHSWLAAGLLFLIPLVGCEVIDATLDSTHFYGDHTSRNARIYVDGEFVGQFDSTNASMPANYRGGFSFYRSLSRGTHDVVVVLATGDSLTGRYRRGDSGGIIVSAEELRLLVHPLEDDGTRRTLALWGDPLAIGARVLLDGARVGRLVASPKHAGPIIRDSTNNYRTTHCVEIGDTLVRAGETEAFTWIETRLGQHTLQVVNATGDTLSSNVLIQERAVAEVSFRCRVLEQTAY